MQGVKKKKKMMRMLHAVPTARMACITPFALCSRLHTASASCLSASSTISPKLASPQLLHIDDNDDDDDEDDENDCHPHVPVLLPCILGAFRNSHLHTFVDCTLGAGGHASAVIREHPEMKIFVGLDVDPLAHSEATPRLQDAVEYRRTTSPTPSDLKVHTFHTNFRNVKGVLEQLDLADRGVDGIMMDLGMSSMQLNVAGRGFSLQQDGPIDMRMDPSAILKGSDILNDWPEIEIGRIIREYGEERQWKRLAWKISETQLSGGIHSTLQLLDLIQKTLPSKFSPGRAGWKKTAIRVFQALRIAVNDELAALEVALHDAYACLSSKGRLAVISFHSLEDRIVKQFFLKAIGEAVNKNSLQAKYDRKRTGPEDVKQEGGRNKIVQGTHALILTKRPIVAGVDEIKNNRRARSAKLRILEKS